MGMGSPCYITNILIWNENLHSSLPFLCFLTLPLPKNGTTPKECHASQHHTLPFSSSSESHHCQTNLGPFRTIYFLIFQVYHISHLLSIKNIQIISNNSYIAWNIFFFNHKWPYYNFIIKREFLYIEKTFINYFCNWLTCEISEIF